MKGAVSCWSKTALAVGLFFCLLAGLLLGFWSDLIDYFLKKELQIAPGTKRFQHWQQTPIPMYIDIYFFNWTNPEWIESSASKPIFTEMGPYRFYETRTKVGLVWHANKTVTFKQTRHWYFDPENSNGTLNDVVTTVNIVPLVAARMMRGATLLDRVGLSFGFTTLRQTISTRRTVEELLFRGYSDDLLTLANYVPLLTKGAKVSDKFGWFYQRNGSDVQDGVFNMETGEGDLSRVGRLVSWNHRNETGFFKGRCGAVSGTTGEVFPPGLTSSDRLGLFSPDLCRTIYLEYDGETEVSGIPGLKFGGTVDMVDSGRCRKENECFCEGECPPTGVLNLTECRNGAPLFVSYPHFHLGDPELLEQVEGLSPDPDKHSFHITVQPDLGVPLEIKGRFQVNLMIEPNFDILIYRNIPRRMYMPVMWFDQRAVVKGPLATEVNLLVAAPGLGRLAGYASLFLGTLLVSLALLTSLTSLTKRESPRKSVPNVPLTRRQTEEPLLGV